LDDGGHRLHAQIACFEALWPVSLYVVEDAGGFVEYAKSLVGKAHVGFYNDLVTIEPWVEIHKIDSGG